MSSQASYERLREENRLLRCKLGILEAELCELRGKGKVPLSPKSPTPSVSVRERSESRKRGRGGYGVGSEAASLGAMVAEAVGEGKRRRVGDSIDPESRRKYGIPVGIKIGGVRWEDGIGGAEAALVDAGFEICEGGRWLVAPEELEKRRERGSLASTVLVKVRGVEAASVLCKAGLWVGGAWCSCRRFVAVAPRKKEPSWIRLTRKVVESTRGWEEAAFKRVADAVKVEVKEGSLEEVLRELGKGQERLEAEVVRTNAEMHRGLKRVEEQGQSGGKGKGREEEVDEMMGDMCGAVGEVLDSSLDPLCDAVTVMDRKMVGGLDEISVNLEGLLKRVAMVTKMMGIEIEDMDKMEMEMGRDEAPAFSTGSSRGKRGKRGKGR